MFTEASPSPRSLPRIRPPPCCSFVASTGWSPRSPTLPLSYLACPHVLTYLNISMKNPHQPILTVVTNTTPAKSHPFNLLRSLITLYFHIHYHTLGGSISFSNPTISFSSPELMPGAAFFLHWENSSHQRGMRDFLLHGSPLHLP